MPSTDSNVPHVATMDVCLAGVFVARGETIPPDLYDLWRRELMKMGLERDEPLGGPSR